jgi:hypothetical protein
LYCWRWTRIKCIYPFLFSFYLNYVEQIFQERDSKGLDSIDMEEEFVSILNCVYYNTQMLRCTLKI